MNLLIWRIVGRASAPAQCRPLPSAVLTVGPAFRHESLPPEVALLLPTTAGADGLSAALATMPATGLATGLERFADRALGLFLADPFLNLAGQVSRLRRAGVASIANLPTVEQQDLEFAQQLADVGLDFAREVDHMSQFRRAGFNVIAAVAGAPAAAAVRPLDPQAVVVIPRTADFAAGFPSFRRRGAIAREVAAAMRAAGWQGPLLGLATAGEAAHETLWPEMLDGVLCRPEPLLAQDLIP